MALFYGTVLCPLYARYRDSTLHQYYYEKIQTICLVILAFMLLSDAVIYRDRRHRALPIATPSQNTKNKSLPPQPLLLSYIHSAG